MDQYSISMHFIFLPMFILVLLLMIETEVIFSNVFAASPSFVRQEIQDSRHDLFQLDDYHHNITRLSNDTETNVMLDDSIDIDRVSYFSDGKVLNATIWLRKGFDGSLFEITPVVNFGMIVDVNPHPTIGIGGVGYHKEVQHPAPFDLP